MKTNQRIPYYDMLRGIAIIGVVAIHSSGVGLNIQSSPVNVNFTIVWRQLINFSVPLFLVISGFFASNKIVNNPKSYLTFIKKQVPKVYFPCLFWSMVFILLTLPNIGLVQYLIRKMAGAFICTTLGPYYFIALIIQYYLLLPILKKYSKTTSHLIFWGSVSILMALVIFYIRYYTNLSLPIILYAGFSPTWVIFFVYGLYLGGGNQVPIRHKTISRCVIFFFLLELLETYFLWLNYGQIGNAVTAVKPTAYIYSFLVISYFFSMKHFYNTTQHNTTQHNTNKKNWRNFFWNISYPYVSNSSIFKDFEFNSKYLYVSADLSIYSCFVDCMWMLVFDSYETKNDEQKVFEYYRFLSSSRPIVFEVWR